MLIFLGYSSTVDVDKMSEQFENLCISSESGSESEEELEDGHEYENEQDEAVWKWWEEEIQDDNNKIKWTFLEHKGPAFAPAYEPLPPEVRFYYDGRVVKLSQNAEEVAGFYARMLEHPFTTKSIFNNNFFTDWRNVMTPDERKIITDFRRCNFREMHAYYQEKIKNRSNKEKNDIKMRDEELQKNYGYCILDGHKQKLTKFKLEPPNLFRGRGENPKMGMLKKRVTPEDIVINCSEDSQRPEPPPGHHWKGVKHDNTVTWLAYWVDNIQQETKYIRLHPDSKLKGIEDWKKYELASKLHKCIDRIRDQYREDWKSSDIRVCQRAVALYFIDRLALRAGASLPRGKDEADAVGCCSLLVKHIKLHKEKNGKKYVVVFDFLGKDSVRYYNEVPVEECVFKNLDLFMENKIECNKLFDKLNTQALNKHLKELMPGLSAKVFRTYNASITLQRQLNELTDENASIKDKIDAYKRANLEVAKLCNHQWAVSKAKQQQNEAETNRLAPLTSRKYYNDPRITIAWCKKHGVPVEEIFSKEMRDKFRWAFKMPSPYS